MASKKQPKELYLKIPYHILNIRGLGLSEKVLLAHIYSFGDRGCWQSNETLAELFMVCRRTVSLWLASLVKFKLVQIKSSKGYYRTIWAKSHPDVKDAARLWYRKEQIDNPETRASQASAKTSHTRAKTSPEVGKNMRGECAKSSIRLRKNLRTTNNTTNKETIKETIAPPSPSPRSNGAQSALEQRRLAYREELGRFCRNFGSSAREVEPPTAETLELRRQAQLRSLVPDKHKRISLGGPETKEHKPLSEQELERRARRQKAALLAGDKKNSKAKKTKNRRVPCKDQRKKRKQSS